MDRITKTNSVSIHIRRGDYVTLGFAFDNRVYQDCAKNFAQNTPGKWELFVF
ncbi:MAG: hypothetical protein K2G28_09210 [Acetatifactor sp.]|nr:hypothetical protein [Acetatifactor sp.]